MRYRSEIYAKEGIGFTKAKALHYNGPLKPWKADQILPAAQRDPSLILATRLWNDAYMEVLQLLHFKSSLQTLKPGEVI